MHIHFENTERKALVDWWSVCTTINKSLGNAVVLNSIEIYRTQTPEFHDLKTFSNELIKTFRVKNNTVKCNDWLATNVNVTFVGDGHRPIIGWDLFPQLGYSLTESK